MKIMLMYNEFIPHGRRVEIPDDNYGVYKLPLSLDPGSNHIDFYRSRYVANGGVRVFLLKPDHQDKIPPFPSVFNTPIVELRIAGD